MGFGGGAAVVACGGAGVVAGGGAGMVVGGAGGLVVGGAGGFVVCLGDGLADGLAVGGLVVGDADGLAECAVAVGLGAEEWAATAVLQPAVNAASSASPTADRVRGKDMDQPFRFTAAGKACVMRTYCRHAHICDTVRHSVRFRYVHGAGCGIGHSARFAAE
jgi:hypothetical protein